MLGPEVVGRLLLAGLEQAIPGELATLDDVFGTIPLDLDEQVRIPRGYVFEERVRIDDTGHPVILVVPHAAPTIRVDDVDVDARAFEVTYRMRVHLVVTGRDEASTTSARYRLLLAVRSALLRRRQLAGGDEPVEVLASLAEEYSAVGVLPRRRGHLADAHLDATLVAHERLTTPRDARARTIRLDVDRLALAPEAP